jgi:hypothetical protein
MPLQELILASMRAARGNGCPCYCWFFKVWTHAHVLNRARNRLIRSPIFSATEICNSLQFPFINYLYYFLLSFVPFSCYFFVSKLWAHFFLFPFYNSLYIVILSYLVLFTRFSFTIPFLQFPFIIIVYFASVYQNTYYLDYIIFLFPFLGQWVLWGKTTCNSTKLPLAT